MMSLLPAALAVVVTVTTVLVGGSVVEAQTPPTIDTAPDATATLEPPTTAATPAPTPEAPDPGSPRSSSGASSFPFLSQDQANSLFDSFLLHGFEKATDGVRTGLQRLVQDTNLVTVTSATWTYQQPTVVALQAAVQSAANATLGLLIFWMGLNVLLRPQLGGTLLEIREVIPRLVLGAGLANSAGHWTALAIDLNNAVCAQIFAASAGSLGDLFSQLPMLNNTWLIALLLVGFLIAWAWLYLTMAGRMAMLMVLLVLAPAAQLCWVLPQTRGLADRWHGKFWTTLYAQVVVTAALKLAWGFGVTVGLGNPIALLITICLLFLAANSPDLLAGGAARIGLGGILEMALLASRASALAPAAAGGAAMAGAARGVSAGASAGSTVAANSVPRVNASPIAVAAQHGGTGGGIAATGKSSGFGRGGRSADAATNKGHHPDGEATA